MGTNGENRHQRYVARLGRRTAKAGGARTVFGQAVEREGVTVIPVAGTVWGFGGGSGGAAEDEERSGAGGGGGGFTYPVGYIRITDGKTSFRPIVGPGPLVAVGAAIAVAVAAGLRRR